MRTFQTRDEVRRLISWWLIVTVGVSMGVAGCAPTRVETLAHFEGAAVNLMPDGAKLTNMDFRSPISRLDDQGRYLWHAEVTGPWVFVVLSFPEQPKIAGSEYLAGADGMTAYLYRYKLDNPRTSSPSSQFFHYTPDQWLNNPSIIPLQGSITYHQSEDQTVTIGLDLTGEAGNDSDQAVIITGNIIQTRREYKGRARWPFPISFIQWWIEMSRLKV